MNARRALPMWVAFANIPTTRVRKVRSLSMACARRHPPRVKSFRRATSSRLQAISNRRVTSNRLRAISSRRQVENRHRQVTSSLQPRINNRRPVVHRLRLHPHLHRRREPRRQGRVRNPRHRRQAGRHPRHGHARAGCQIRRPKRSRHSRRVSLPIRRLRSCFPMRASGSRAFRAGCIPLRARMPS